MGQALRLHLHQPLPPPSIPPQPCCDPNLRQGVSDPNGGKQTFKKSASVQSGQSNSGEREPRFEPSRWQRTRLSPSQCLPGGRKVAQGPAWGWPGTGGRHPRAWLRAPLGLCCRDRRGGRLFSRISTFSCHLHLSNSFLTLLKH